jgi:hypothetical protein
VLNALKADACDFLDPEEKDEEVALDFRSRLADVDGMDDDDNILSGGSLWGSSGEDDEAVEKRKVRPEAEPSPRLFVQEGALDDTKRSFHSDAKKDASAKIVSLAREHGLPIAEVDKGILNTCAGTGRTRASS